MKTKKFIVLFILFASIVVNAKEIVKMCKDCSGKGWNYEEVTCRQCDGTGKAGTWVREAAYYSNAKPFFKPNTGKDEGPCRKCAGSLVGRFATGKGTIKEKVKCTACNGKGKITETIVNSKEVIVTFPSIESLEKVIALLKMNGEVKLKKQNVILKIENMETNLE